MGKRLLCSTQKRQLCSWDGAGPPCSTAKHQLHNREQVCTVAPQTPPLKTGWGTAMLQHPKTPFPSSCCNLPSAPFQSNSTLPACTGKLRHSMPSLPWGRRAGGQPPAQRRVRVVLTALRTAATGRDKDTHVSRTKQLSELRASSVPTSPEAEAGPAAGHMDCTQLSLATSGPADLHTYFLASEGTGTCKTLYKVHVTWHGSENRSNATQEQRNKKKIHSIINQKDALAPKRLLGVWMLS